MDDNIIELQNVHKIFRYPRERRDTLKESFLNFHKKVEYKDLYALNDINLNVKRGEFIGIIGKNGSGKSTLLRIIANIYKPTNGSVKVLGDVSPFLELGIGFNGELTARENVYLNGTILGLTKKEIDEKYHEIVSFAELENFMAMKLKNFSSGMQLRLAFSVAIQADTDIYLCDEVLSVGDVSFQKKCFNVFTELKNKGKTIVYVSHDLKSIKDFSSKAYYMDGGKIISSGSTENVVEKYLSDLNVSLS